MPEALEARRLVELRDHWLNPPEWVEWVDEPVPGYPQRPVPRDEEAAKALKKRTLTNLYNARPQWLVDAHEALDAACGCGALLREAGGGSAAPVVVMVFVRCPDAGRVSTLREGGRPSCDGAGSLRGCVAPAASNHELCSSGTNWPRDVSAV